MTRRPDLFEEAAELRARGAAAAMATVIGVRGSAPARDAMRMLVLADGTTRGTVGGGALEDDIRRLGLEVIGDDASRRATLEISTEAADDSEMVCGGAVEVFVEPITVPTCFIFGSGHLATAVAPVAAVAGFRVVVADDRPSHATAARFPDAAEVLAKPFPEVFAALAPRLGPGSFCVVVTRSHRLDEDCVEACLRASPRWVGMIGSSNKVQRCRDALTARGLPAARVASLRAPVGLDLGAETHGEIAVAIVAEMVAVRRRSPLATAVKTAGIHTEPGVAATGKKKSAAHAPGKVR
ncbi:MAG: XdhC family protein [Planctomycetes bacterium]|nr:XdhC family protein [Planctomycetota bacterium]